MGDATARECVCSLTGTPPEDPPTDPVYNPRNEDNISRPKRSGRGFNEFQLNISGLREISPLLVTRHNICRNGKMPGEGPGRGGGMQWVRIHLLQTAVITTAPDL